MKKFLTSAYISAKTAKFMMSDKVKSFLKEEKGGAEIIATIVLVAVVVLLALFFKDQITEMVNNIWGAVSGREGDITSPIDGGGAAG